MPSHSSNCCSRCSEAHLKGPCLKSALCRAQRIRECYRKFARLCCLPTSIANVGCALKSIFVRGRIWTDFVFRTLCHVTLHHHLLFSFDVEPGPNVVADFCATCRIDLGLPRPETEASQPTFPLHTQIGVEHDCGLVHYFVSNLVQKLGV